MQDLVLQSLNKETILIVEDTSAYRLFVKRAFRGMGVNIVFVNDGRSALEYLKDNDPDIVLLDWNIPHFDGGEVLSKIKLKDNRKSPVFIIMTTSKNENDRITAYSHGAYGYIKKPSSLSKARKLFQHMINFWFDEHMLLPKRWETENGYS